MYCLDTYHAYYVTNRWQRSPTDITKRTRQEMALKKTVAAVRGISIFRQHGRLHFTVEILTKGGTL